MKRILNKESISIIPIFIKFEKIIISINHCYYKIFILIPSPRLLYKKVQMLYFIHFININNKI